MSIRDDITAIPNADLNSGNVSLAILVHMDFADTPRRWWAGWGDIEAGGHTWTGYGDVISMSGVSTDYGLTADPLTFKLAATREMIDLAKSARDRVYHRPCIVYGQLLNKPDQTLIGPPWALQTTTMRQLGVSAGGAVKRELTLTCEGLFTRRNAPPRGRMTDMDQKARHPGDRGMERAPLYVDYQVKWI